MAAGLRPSKKSSTQGSFDLKKTNLYLYGNLL